jgi:hypothetical protein
MALEHVAQIGADAHLRTRTRTVVFRESFTLSAFEGSQPAGIYQVESDEELLPTVSAPAYRRVAT